MTGPSGEEYEEHMRTHIPFRSWCEFCIKGKSKSDHHRKNGGNKEDPLGDKIAVVAIDYTFPMQKAEDRSEHGGMPILVMKNSLDKWVSGIVVPQKGACEYAVKAVARKVQNGGYNRIIMKSDQEPAIKELLHAVKRERAEKIEFAGIGEEESAVGESSSNGMVERAIQDVQAQMRTLRLALEWRYWEEKIKEDHPI